MTTGVLFFGIRMAIGASDSAWAVRPLALPERGAETVLVLEDPGGETLDGFISGPMEMTQFLGFAVGLHTLG